MGHFEIKSPEQFLQLFNRKSVTYKTEKTPIVSNFQPFFVQK